MRIRFQQLTASGLLVLMLASAGELFAQTEDDLKAAFNRAYEANRQHNPGEAIKNYEAALAIAPRVLGESHANTVEILKQLSYLYYSQGNHRQANKIELRLVKIVIAQKGENDVAVAERYARLAVNYHFLDDYKQSEEYFIKCQKIYQTKFGADGNKVADVENDLGNLYVDSHEFDKAEAVYLHALQVYKQQTPVDELDVALVQQGLAILYMKTSRFAKAESLFEASQKTSEAKLSANDQVIAERLASYAALFVDTGRLSAAEPMLLRSVAIFEKTAPQSPNFYNSLNNLAGLYTYLGQYDKAESLYQQNLKLSQTAYGENSSQTALTLSALGNLYSRKRDYPQAQQFFQRSLDIRERVLGPDHPDVAESLNALGNNYREQAQYAPIEPLLQRSLKIRLKTYGENHVIVASAINDLALYYNDAEKFELAESMFERSRKIYESIFGSNYHRLADTTWRNLALVHEAQNQSVRASDDFDHARRIVRKHVATVLPMLNEKEQLAFMQRTSRSELFLALTLGWKHPHDPQIAARSANWLANDKAVTQETLVQQTILARDSKDPRATELLPRLLAVRTQLANLANAEPKSDQEETRRLELAKLTESENSLVKQLNSVGEKCTPPKWIETDTLRQALAKDAVLVDILCITPPVYRAEPGQPRQLPARYVAWVTPATGAGKVQVIDLGEAAAIDKAVSAFRTVMATAQSGKSLHELGEPEAEKQVKVSLSTIAKLALEPLLPHLKGKSEIVLSPDANLWLVPWSALPTDDDQYAIEKWNIHYVTSARDLLIKPANNDSNKRTSGLPRIFANPNYDLPVSQIPAVMASIFGRATAALLVPKPISISNSPTSPTTNSNSLPSTRRAANAIGRVPLLPGTAAEAEAITPNLKTYAGEPKLYAGQQALEVVFKHLRSPKVLVLSTHGYFLPEQPTNVNNDSQTSSRNAGRNMPTVDAEGQPLENPMLRCGLLLAGCNERANLADRSLDDGVLTGMEIVGTDLRGTELVVLSACETGIGKVNNGEGVAGLRQAFQLAGAQAVVATLWQIPDQATAQLMNDFFANLAEGQSKSESLRNAQLKTIKARREKYGAAHPLFWAAFTLTGGN